MEEPKENKYFRHKRKEWATRLNEHCENKDCEEFREWDANELFPNGGWNVRSYCWYSNDDGESWDTCDSCKELLKEYHQWLSLRNDYIDGLGQEIRELRKEIRALRDLIK